MSKFIQGIKRKPVLILIVVVVFVGLFVANQYFAGEINGSDEALISTRAIPSDGAEVGYGYVNIGGTVEITGQFEATEKAYISTVTVKWWRGGESSNKQTIFSETLASNTYATWSKTKPIYLLFYTSPSAPSGEYHVSIVVTTSGATVYGTKSDTNTFKVKFAPGTSPTETATTTEEVDPIKKFFEDAPSFEFILVPLALVILYIRRRGED